MNFLIDLLHILCFLVIIALVVIYIIVQVNRKCDEYFIDSYNILLQTIKKERIKNLNLHLKTLRNIEKMSITGYEEYEKLIKELESELANEISNYQIAKFGKKSNENIKSREKTNG